MKRSGPELDAFLPNVPWGWTERTRPIETFDYTCHQCKRCQPCERLVVSRHRTVFGVSVSRAGPPRDVVRCTRCGHDMHPRDVIDLVSPRTQELYRQALQDATAALDSGPSIDLSDAEGSLAITLRALRDEASRPISEQLLRAIADVARSDGRDPSKVLVAIENIGRLLLIDRREIVAIATTV